MEKITGKLCLQRRVDEPPEFDDNGHPLIQKNPSSICIDMENFNNLGISANNNMKQDAATE